MTVFSKNHRLRAVLVACAFALCMCGAFAAGVEFSQSSRGGAQPQQEEEAPDDSDSEDSSSVSDAPSDALSDDGAPQSPSQESSEDSDANDSDADGMASQDDSGVSSGDDAQEQGDEYDEGPGEGDAAPEGMEPEGESLQKALDSYFDTEFPPSNVPGIAVAVFDKNSVRYARELGACNSEHQTFIIGSLSKSFTAVSIMQLVEQGKVDLDAPASAYVPQYRTPDSVTIRLLLNQTSGFGYYDSLADATVGPSAGHFSYANANYDLLGRVVEAVSGEDYGTYLKEHIFDPLGMSDASAGMSEPQAEQVPLYRNYFGFNVADGFVHHDSDDAWGTASSGYVRASLSDMEKYLQMYLNGGEGILEPDDVMKIFLSRVPDPDGDTYYGFGWTTFSWDDGELVCSHDGQVENGVARMCLLPDRSMGVVVLGDASDYFGGNANFFQMCDDVVSLSIGGEALGIDRGALLHGHAEANVLLAVIAGAAVFAVASLRRWWRGLAQRKRSEVWWRLFFLHVMLPAALLAFPSWQGVFWRDLFCFVPDVAYTLAISAAVLIATGVGKLIAWLVWLRRTSRLHGEEQSD